MKKKTDEKAIIAAILILSIALGISSVMAKLEGEGTSDICSYIPLNIGEWKGHDIVVPEKDLAILEADRVLAMQFTNPEEGRIDLLVVECGSNRAAFHPPELCYLGGDYRLESRKTDTIPTDSGELKANKLIFSKYGMKEIVFYWYYSEAGFTDNYYSQQLNFLLDKLRRTKTNGALIRVSSRFTDDTEKEISDTVKSFSKLLVREIKIKSEK